MKMLLTKEGASNIKILVLFSFVVIMLAVLGVSIFASGLGTIDQANGRWVNITSISDANGNYLIGMNGTEYLALTAYNVTIRSNKTFQSDDVDLYYDVDAAPDGTGSSDCVVHTSSGSTLIWSFTIPSGGGGGGSNCPIIDGSRVAILIRSYTDGVNHYANYTGNVTGTDFWNFTVDGAAPTGAWIGLNESGGSGAGGIVNNSWVTSMVMRFNGSDATTLNLTYRLYVNGSVNVTKRNLTTSQIVQNDSLKNLAEGGYYLVLIEVVDNVSNKLNSTPIKFWYDGTNPTHVNITNLNTTRSNFSNSGLITFMAYDGAGQPLNYNVYLNSTVNASYASGTNGGTTSFNLNTGQLVNGSYYAIVIEVADNASNKLNSTLEAFWYDTISPKNAAITTPASNNLWAGNMTIIFNATDDVMQVPGYPLNYTILVNSTVNVTGSNLSASGTKTNAVLTGLREGGYYNITLRVYDYAGNYNETTRFAYFDGTGPTITLEGTSNKTKTSSRMVSFTIIDGAGRVDQSSITVTGNNSLLTGVFNSTTMCISLSNGSIGYTCTYIENGLEPGAASPQLKIDAQDNASNAATTYYLEMNVTAGFKYNLSLASGWNLISTPLILENTSINNVVANNSNITKIYYYDASTPWTWWLTDGSDTLTTMEPLKGYWVYTTGATKMQFFGNKTTGTPPRGYGLSNPMTLSASTWYLIGYYMSNFSGSSYNTDSALSAMCTGGLCSGASTLKFDVLQWYDTTAVELTPALKTNYNSDGIWTRGRGFWIYMNSAHTFQGTPS